MQMEESNFICYAMRVFDRNGPSINTMMIVEDLPSVKRNY
jgi:hypothetical protein